ncbi:MAG: tRNA (guanosine(46)-N7)-methyltransferase TrmB [Gammaproteobacteria bacterium]
MTPAQKRALEELLPRYGFDPDRGVLNLDALFGRRAPRLLEIGFGTGTSLLEMATAHPERDYLGVEVHRPGVGALLLRLEQAGLTNVRVACGDAVQVLDHTIADASLDGVYVFFPDPWHKKRHHKRRLLQPAFVATVAAKLRPGGLFHMATDWEDYARHMLSVMEGDPEYVNCAGAGAFSPRGERPRTKYEQRGERLGHRVWDLVFQRR